MALKTDFLQDRQATIGDLLRRCTADLQQHGCATPQLDARLLLMRAFGLDHAGLILNESAPIEPHAASALDEMVARRRSGEPVARILGEREFYGITLKVSPAVLDPRPETETLIDAAQELLGDRLDEPLRILDLGTGSGAIIIALLHIFPKATGMAVDVSADALEIAEANARSAGVLDRVEFRKGRWMQGLDEPFDLIVSNPPYIEADSISGLAPEVRNFDPMIALDGGHDGLTAYRELAPGLVRILTPMGYVLLEVGHDQAEAVLTIVEAAQLTRLGETGAIFKDLAGLDRVVALRRPI